MSHDRKGNRHLLFGAVLLCTLWSVNALATGRMESRYNGAWWLSVPKLERNGFLNGYYDCYIYKYKGRATFGKHPPDIAQKLVTKVYKHDNRRLAESVSQVFMTLRDPPGWKPPADDGEQNTKLHGYFRGLFWGALYRGSNVGQVGFIEGYLDCYAHLINSEEGRFSKDPVTYVKEINRWYGFNPYNETLLIKREDVPIADVLEKFRDR